MIEKMSYIQLATHQDMAGHLIERYLLNYDIELAGQAQLRQGMAQAGQPVISNEAVKDQLMADIAAFEPYLGLDIDIGVLQKMAHISFGFGKINSAHYEGLLMALEDEPVIVQQGETVGQDAHVAYFYAKRRAEAILDILASQGVVIETLNLRDFATSLEEAQQILSGELMYIIEEEEVAMTLAETYEVYTDIIRNHPTEATDAFHVYEGFIPTKHLAACQNQVREDPKVLLVQSDVGRDPPVRLVNHRWVRPFELFVKAYGLPDYRGIDPTLWVAVVYTFLFGVMFGDVGQGAVILAIGYVFQPPIKHIVMTLGASAMVFGFLYGSVFGFEHVLPALWLRPSEEINYLIYLSVVLGMVMVSGSILLNVLTGWRQKAYKEVFVGASSVTGLGFYGGLVGVVFTENLWFLGLGVPFVAVLMAKLVKRPKDIFAIVMETFEQVMAYGTNTLSFIRVGAIVLSHSAMMGAVFMLSQNMSLAGSILMVGLGNLFVMAMEVMVVGIQVLRLNYYEMFSRYYKSGGRGFVPLRTLIEEGR